jgi:hypothetical protein
MLSSVCSRILASLFLACLLCTASCGGTSSSTDLTDVPDSSLDASDEASLDTPQPDSGEDTGVDLPEPIDTYEPDTTTDTDEPADIQAADTPDGTDLGPYTRPQEGDPVTAEEIAEVTDLFLDLLDRTRYFDVLDERIHGWPRSDPQERYWYGTWWSGVRIVKADGNVTFLHSADGADNNGMRTGPMLVGACYASRIWGLDRDLDLVRRMVRGFTSWIRAFESPSNPEWAGILSRASYPESVTSLDGGREFLIDYSLNRPGEYNDATTYVNVPDNPLWGDIWVKNKRSKDDIGHMMLALAMIDDCIRPGPVDELDPEVMELQDDIADLHARYREWARTADTDGFRFATVDVDGTVYFPDQDLAYLWLDFGNIECEGALALRLYHSGEPGDLDCGDGISELEAMPGLKNDFYQIQRSFHEAAVAIARASGWDDGALRELLTGLAWRVLQVLDSPEDQAPIAEDRSELVIMSANAGLPLTWREVRYLHDRIRQAHQAVLDAGATTAYGNPFSAEYPDGTQGLEPPLRGIHWRYLGAMLGDCASPYRHPDSRPILDCDRVREHR